MDASIITFLLSGVICNYLKCIILYYFICYFYLLLNTKIRIAELNLLSLNTLLR
nr:MAG TPA: hypothetical protein [Caudoviricetes sp.]